jgi:hypothetical protein
VVGRQHRGGCRRTFSRGIVNESLEVNAV